jgi:hypothetical protein
MKSRLAALSAAILLGGLFPSNAHAQADREPVLNVVNELLRAISTRDSLALQAILTADGHFTVVSVNGDSTVVRRSTHAQSITSIGKAPQPLLERMWDPQVMTDGTVATVWAPYDFHVAGVFSHCGTDVFTLVRTRLGWRVTGATYTVVRTGCPPSPLGPPKS